MEPPTQSSGVMLAPYVDWIMRELPHVQQIDSDNVVMIRRRREMINSGTNPRAQQLAKAQAILKDIVKD